MSEEEEFDELKELRITALQESALVRTRALDTNPAAVYLASLSSQAGRRTQKQALDTITALLTAGKETDCLNFPWEKLRYAHTAAIRGQLVSIYSPATANKCLSAMRRTLKEAWRLGMMTAEEYQRAADIPSVAGDRIPAGRELATEELAALLAICETDTTAAGVRDGAIIAVLYSAGLRRQEIVSLDLENYDPPTARLIIHGKRSKERTAYLNDGAVGALSDWIIVRGIDPGALFHPVTKGGKLLRRRMSNQAIYNLLEKRGKQASVNKFSPHDMRRTFVSDLLDAGADIATVAKMAGHSNVQTTARYDRRGESVKQKASTLLSVPYHKRKKMTPKEDE